MPAGGDDDTIAGTEPARAGADHDLPELIAGRYRIVRWLGGGGMGRVYEAVDTELDVRVALKVLRGGLSDDALERFRREVRLTRRIQHPNVARMFDIGDHAGDKFLTMELIDGEPLTRQLGTPLPWSRLSPLAIQLCEGLAAAHRVGVIHRDLKPDNILIEHGTDRVVITDFGIARSVDDAAVTQVGVIIGTPRYMAPEQLAGREVDARSDVFSLGVLLYELASGTRPWAGEHAIAIAVAQATQLPPPLMISALPPGFNALVSRCIELEPARRPPTTTELLALLMSPTAMAGGEAAARSPRATVPPLPTARAAESKLAVLPFDCAAGDEYLADGIHEDLIDTLSTTPTLRVRPAGTVRSSAAQDPRDVGRQLEVDHVVAGALRRTPAGLRVSARLVGVADGFQIWAHRADCSEADVLAISETLGREIATALSTRASAASRPTDPRSVELYLRARAELRRFWGSHAQTAADLLDQALTLSPTSHPIAAARAFATVQAWVLQADPALLDRVNLAVEHGLATGHPEALLAASSYRFNTGDPIGGATDLGMALVRAPMLAQAHEMAAKILVEVGATADARHHFETAIALDPARTAVVEMELARLDALEGWWERADRRIAALLDDPDRSLVQLAAVFQARLAAWRGDRGAMFRAAEKFGPRLGGPVSNLIEFVRKTVTSGVVDERAWQGFLGTFGGTERPQRGQLMGLQLLTEMAILLDQGSVCFETLEQADRLNFIDIVVLDRCPLLDQVSTSPRFVAVRERVAVRAAAVLAAFRAAR